MRKWRCKHEYLIVAFGFGCILSCCLPTAWIVRLLAFVVILLGIMLCCKK